MQYIEKTNIFSIKTAHHHANLEFTATMLPNTTHTISKSFSPPQGNAIALHYPTNTHHILPIYYTAPSHNPCIFNISSTMLLLILVKLTYLLQAQIPHTQHISFKRKSQITHTMWNLHPRERRISRMQESVGGGEEIHFMQYIEKTNIFSIKTAHHHANLEFTATMLPNTTHTISKSFSPPQGNAITLHYPTNTHHILPIYYTAPSHNPCIFNISNTMLLLILVTITYLLQAQIPHTQHISFKRKSQITHTMWNLQTRERRISRMQESVGGGEEIHFMQYIEKTNIFSIKTAHHHANLEFTATLLPNTTYTISKSFSSPHGNAIALHYPTNTHHILPIYYTAPSHNPCIFNISNTMLLLILVKITYLLQAQIPHTQHISFKKKSQITHTMWDLPTKQ